MLAVVPLVSLTDRLPARKIYLASSALSALSCFGVALCDSLLPALDSGLWPASRRRHVYAGPAGAHPWRRRATRARIAAWYTVRSRSARHCRFCLAGSERCSGWRSAFLLAGILGVAGVLDCLGSVAAGRSVRTRAAPAARLSARCWEIGMSLSLIFGYAAAIWGSVGLRQWIVVFLAFCAGGSGRCSGARGDYSGGRSADQFSRRPRRPHPRRALNPLRPAHHRYPGLRALGVAGGLFGFQRRCPLWPCFSLSVIAGFIVQGNFSDLTSGVLAVAARGTAGNDGSIPVFGFGGRFSGHSCSASRSTNRREIVVAAWGVSLRPVGRLFNRAPSPRFPVPRHLAVVNSATRNCLRQLAPCFVHRGGARQSGAWL